MIYIDQPALIANGTIVKCHHNLRQLSMVTMGVLRQFDNGSSQVDHLIFNGRWGGGGGGGVESPKISGT